MWCMISQNINKIAHGVAWHGGPFLNGSIHASSRHGRCPSGEDSGFRSLLGTSDPTVWHVALASLPALPTGETPEGEPDLDLVETLRQEGERLVEAEAAVFERDLQVWIVLLWVWIRDCLIFGRGLLSGHERPWSTSLTPEPPAEEELCRLQVAPASEALRNHDGQGCRHDPDDTGERQSHWVR